MSHEDMLQLFDIELRPYRSNDFHLIGTRSRIVISVPIKMDTLDLRPNLRRKAIVVALSGLNVEDRGGKLEINQTFLLLS
jgi:hypothetical protein